MPRTSQVAQPQGDPLPLEERMDVGRVRREKALRIVSGFCFSLLFLALFLCVHVAFLGVFFFCFPSTRTGDLRASIVV